MQCLRASVCHAIGCDSPKFFLPSAQLRATVTLVSEILRVDAHIDAFGIAGHALRWSETVCHSQVRANRKQTPCYSSCPTASVGAPDPISDTDVAIVGDAVRLKGEPLDVGVRASRQVLAKGRLGSRRACSRVHETPRCESCRLLRVVSIKGAMELQAAGAHPVIVSGLCASASGRADSDSDGRGVARWRWGPSESPIGRDGQDHDGPRAITREQPGRVQVGGEVPGPRAWLSAPGRGRGRPRPASAAAPRCQ